MCVTVEDFSPAGHPLPAGWPQGVDVLTVERTMGRTVSARLSRASAAVSAWGGAGAYVHRKLNAACAYVTGHDFHVWHVVERWRRSIERAVQAFEPDFIVVRGAGAEFEPHMAMLRWRSPIPWVAYYNDPYPISLYPRPYQQYTPILSGRQERIHREIVAQADALIFPCARLLEWVLARDLVRHRRKAFVVPHISTHRTSAPSAAVSSALTNQIVTPGHFNIVHTGSLMLARDPKALLKGFADFIAHDPERRRLSRLTFVGYVHRVLAALPEWTALINSGNVFRYDQRVSYWQARDIMGAADVLVLLEAEAPESPFYPGKLADYLSLQRPILAMSPKRSGTADILGNDYPLRVQPTDAAGITRLLSGLWEHWRARRLDDCLPPARARDACSEQVAQGRVADMFAFLSSTERRRAS